MISEWLNKISSSFRDDVKLEMDRYKSHVFHHFNKLDYYKFLAKKVDNSKEITPASPFPWPVSAIPACSSWKDLPGHSGSNRFKQFTSLAKTGHRVDLYTFLQKKGERSEDGIRSGLTTMDVHYFRERLFWLRILLPRENGVRRNEQISVLGESAGVQNLNDLYTLKFRLEDGSYLMMEDALHLTLHIKSAGYDGIVIEDFLA